MKKILRALVSLGLIVYLVVATLATHRMADNDLCTNMTIIVNDTTPHPFVTAHELSRELQNLPKRAVGMRMGDIDTDSLERLVGSIDKVENVSVVRYSDGSIIMTVDPMIPVARIFEADKSYYINKDGKRMKADARYHIDVPVVEGTFDDKFPPQSVLPLVEYISNNDKWNKLITMIHVESPSNIYLIPCIRGHVIDFGGAEQDKFESKFRRLDRMYTDIIPVKGWEFYDTISVKWDNQVVGKRRTSPISHTGYTIAVDEEEVDVASMLAAEGVAPGQAIEGRKAKSEKPIPGALKAPDLQKVKTDTVKVDADTIKKPD